MIYEELHLQTRHRARSWRVVQARDLDGAQGRCDPDTNTISILSGLSGDNLTALLIHEICHAVTHGYHGQRWQQRMQRAAQDADDRGMTAIADLLRKEIAGYQDGFWVTATEVYNQISDAVSENSKATFVQVVDFLRRQYGLSRPQFLKRFHRARTVFAEAKREAKETAKIKARWLAESNEGEHPSN